MLRICWSTYRQIYRKPATICLSKNTEIDTLNNTGKRAFKESSNYSLNALFFFIFSANFFQFFCKATVAYKVTGNDITGFNYINMSTSGRTAFDVLTFSSPRQSTEIRIVNHIRLKVIGRSAVLQGKSSVNVGPSVGSVLEAGASQTYYMQGGQSGRTVGLIIYEEI